MAFKPQDQSDIRYNNTMMILNIIKNSNGIARSTLAQITGMSATSMTRIVNELLELNLVHETTLSSGGVGRKSILLEINDLAFYTLGIDFAETDISLCIMDFTGKILCKESIPRPLNAAQDISSLIHTLYCTYLNLMERNSLDTQLMAAVGVGAVGSIDREHGIIIHEEITHTYNIPIRQLIEDQFHLPTFIDNDIKCAIIAENLLGAAHRCDDVVMLSFGRGVGSAIINRGKMMRGHANTAGEIGHTIVDFSDGQLCICGRRGCLSAYLMEESILEQARKSDPKIQTIGNIVACYQQNIPWAVSLVDRITNYIVIAINNAINFLNPRNLILGGKLLNDYPLLYQISLDKYNASVTYSTFRPTVRIIPSKLKHDGVCIGSALVAQEKHMLKMIKMPSEFITEQ